MGTKGDEALIGRTIASKYAIQAFLGGGAMGAVYRARQTALEKTVAIKVMHRELTSDEMFAARFHREAKAASRLDHPNSIRVIDFGEEPDGLLYIAMEYVDGRDLYTVLHEDWPISPARIIDLLTQVLAALAVAHEMGVVHRDLKPENIMVIKGTDDEGRHIDVVKVCDFGIAKITEARDSSETGRGGEETHAPTQGAKLTTQGLVVGTPEYMSPEQGRGEPLDARSDLYSMGVILYHLLTGRTPFDAETALGIILKHITDAPKPPREIYAGVEPRLEAICLKALGKRREDRYQTARELRADLRAVAEGAPLDRISRASTELAMPAAGDTSSRPAQTGPGPNLEMSVTMADVRAVTEGAPGPLMPSASRVTPLGTASPAETTQKRSVLPMVAVAALVLAAGGGAFFLGTKSNHDVAALPVPNVPSAVPSTMASATASTTVLAVSDPSPPASVSPPRPDDPPRLPLTKPTGIAVVSAPKPSHSVPETAQTAAPAVPTAIATATPTPAAPPTATPVPVPVAPEPAQALPAAAVINPENVKVTLGAPKVSGGASPSNVRNALHARHGQILACYQVAVRRQPNAGSATLHIETDDNGIVRESSFIGPPPGKFGGECIAAHVRGLKIPNVDTGSLSADIPLTFTLE